MKCPPFANVMKERMRARGRYADGWPKGAIVHFTAGRDGAARTILGGIKDGYTYWCIQRDGKLFCAHDADQWGYHAGESSWTKVVGRLLGSVSDDLIGIEMNAAGKVTQTQSGNFLTWFRTFLTADEVRFTPGKDNQQRGFYQKYTPAQESALIETLMWLKEQNPAVFSFDDVLGHDEVAPKRKNDPGAALSMSMPEFRSFLKLEYERRQTKGQV